MTEELEQVLDRLMERVIVEIGKEERKSIKEPFTLATLKRLFQGVRDPKPEQPNYIPLAALPVIPPEFPKLKVLYDAKSWSAVEWIICEDGAAELPYHAGGWYTRPMEQLESFKAANIPERPAEEYQRRKQLAEKGRQ